MLAREEAMPPQAPSNESSSSSSRSQKNEKDSNITTKKDTSYNQSNFTRQTTAVKNLFSIPTPVKKLFDKVPVVTYPANELPQRSPGAKGRKRDGDGDAKLPSLCVFCREGEENEGRPSFNPGCLKWQVCLPTQCCRYLRKYFKRWKKTKLTKGLADIPQTRGSRS